MQARWLAGLGIRWEVEGQVLENETSRTVLSRAEAAPLLALPLHLTHTHVFGLHCQRMSWRRSWLKRTSWQNWQPRATLRPQPT